MPIPRHSSLSSCDQTTDFMIPVQLKRIYFHLPCKNLWCWHVPIYYIAPHFWFSTPWQQKGTNNTVFLNTSMISLTLWWKTLPWLPSHQCRLINNLVFLTLMPDFFLLLYCYDFKRIIVTSTHFLHGIFQKLKTEAEEFQRRPHVKVKLHKW